MNYFILCIISVLTLLSCGSEPLTGNSSETGNCNIVGVVSLDSGAPAIQIPVILSPDIYKHTDSTVHLDTVVTDGNGHFEFTNVPQGNWTLSAQTSETKGFIHQHIKLNSGDTIYLEEQLIPTGNITIERFSKSKDIIVAILGTPLGGVLKDGETTITLRGIPTNEVVQLAVDTLIYNVQITPNDTDTVKILSNMVIITGPGESSIPEAYRAIIEAVGFRISIVESDTLEIIDMANADIINIMGTPSVSTVLGKFLRESSIPIMNASPTMYPILDMTDFDSGNYGIESVNRFNLVENYKHPIMQALDSFNLSVNTSIQVTYEDGISWGKHLPEASVIGVLAKDQSASPLFTYDKGDSLVSIEAPGRRVGIFANGAQLFTYGEKIYAASLRWLLREI